jgi:hypothetical protein
MPRYRPGCRLPDSVPVTVPFTLPRTSPTHRSDTVRTSYSERQLGWPPEDSALPPRPTDRRTGPPSDVAIWWRSSRAPIPLAPRRPARFPPRSPEGNPDRLGFRSRLALRFPVRGTPSRTHHRRSRPKFRIHRVLPRHFPLPPGIAGSSTVLAQRYAQKFGGRRASWRTGRPSVRAEGPRRAVDGGSARRLNVPHDLVDAGPLRRPGRPRRDHHSVVHVGRPRALRSRPPGRLLRFSGPVWTGATT